MDDGVVDVVVEGEPGVSVDVTSRVAVPGKCPTCGRDLSVQE